MFHFYSVKYTVWALSITCDMFTRKLVFGACLHEWVTTDAVYYLSSLNNNIWKKDIFFPIRDSIKARVHLLIQQNTPFRILTPSEAACCVRVDRWFHHLLLKRCECREHLLRKSLCTPSIFLRSPPLNDTQTKEKKTLKRNLWWTDDARPRFGGSPNTLDVWWVYSPVAGRLVGEQFYNHPITNNTTSALMHSCCQWPCPQWIV